MSSKPEPPEAPDHCATLGVSPDATSIELKRAFRKLALEYHPDKMAPGETVDAIEFRKVALVLSPLHAQD
jgi:curved DNA-binding protein CbpA